ncbi:Sodium/calcium exchanger protein-domain-containing protein [Roridomyces roridus]|uniref:Sodium/calcium exchanger protein-domain-containing protein n=1 Tax=Roridomyces roridus TaxID=1738132 RepID=A0AAD7CLE1_9AGAR|nr:Sodium/calcium exchanger protein-domain-containing protein [Roridomyces roridus]
MVFIPISFVMDATHPGSRSLKFIFSVLSLIPLVKFHEISTRELALRIGGSKTGLVAATMSNLIETVVAISALRKCELRVVQSSLIGSMLSKLLLVLGLCLFAGGVRFSEQDFDTTATQLHSSLLSLSVGAVLLPAAYHFALSGVSSIPSRLQMQNILKMSHGVALVLLFIYGSYLFFQLYSHPHLYKDGVQKYNKSQVSLQQEDEAASSVPSSPLRLTPPRRMYQAGSPYNLSETTLVTESHGVEISRDGTGSLSSDGSDKPSPLHQATKKPQLSLLLVVLLLALVPVAVSITADRLVDSMDGISIPKPWIALIVLPTVSTIAECISAINVSVQDQLSFAISVAVGSTIQIALFVIPFMVSLAWVMGKPLALLFDPFESMVLYISVQVMSSVMSDGRSNYLEGSVLICLYIIVAVSFFFYPVWTSPFEGCGAI